jgi:hypothetical protein
MMTATELFYLLTSFLADDVFSSLSDPPELLAVVEGIFLMRDDLCEVLVLF